MARINMRRIAISLAIGAVCTVASAWMVLRTSSDSPSMNAMPAGSWPIPLPSDWPANPESIQRGDRRGRSSISYHHEGDSSEKITHTAPTGTAYLLLEARFGWPCRALTQFRALKFGSRTPTVVPLRMWYTGVPVPLERKPPSQFKDEHLPVRPLWLGFLANTLFYASIPWLLMFGVATLKRRRRAKRGLCVRCAYPIAGFNICPECGRGVARVANDVASFLGSSVPPPN